MKILFPAIILLLNVFLISAQERYLEIISDEVSVQTLTYTSKDGEELDLDIYTPDSDPETERATLIYVHGGGFQEGERNSVDIQKFCTRIAEHGYVVASISYRLTLKDKEGAFGCDCPVEDKMNTFYAAVEDLQDATFFLIQNRHEFGIDPQKIIIAGSSAGAETVLNTAYQPPYCYDLPSGPVSYAGVISMAGAIPDTTVMFDDSAIPSLLFHGTDDKLVPYTTAAHHFCEEENPGYLILNGSYSIADKLEKLEVPYWLHTTCGGGHEMANKPMTIYFDEIIDFCYNFVINEEKESRKTIIKGEYNNDEIDTFKICLE